MIPCPGTTPEHRSAMTDAQDVANEIRDRLADNAALRRVGIEVLWAAAPAQRLSVRARHRDRVLTIERGAGWLGRPAGALALEMAHELVAEALANGRPALAPPLWRTLYQPDARPTAAAGAAADPAPDPVPPR